MINEVVTIIILYMLVLMTGVFVEDPEKKDQIGWAMIILTIVNFAANIMPILVGILCVYKLRGRRCLNKCAHEAKLKE